MRSRRHYMLPLMLLGMVVALLPGAVLPALASEPSSTGAVTAENIGGGIYGETHRWAPPQLTVKSGGVVTFSNPTLVRHGVYWTSAAKPTCDPTVPVGTSEAASGTEWTGKCTFTQPGSYTYYCTVHGPAMSGTITVPGTPTATTEQPAEVTQTGATLSGAVNPQGEATSYVFQYGTTSSLGQTTPVSAQEVGSDFTAHHLSTRLKGLLPNTEYHVKLVATYGASSTAIGAEKVFTTSPPAKPTTATGSATALTETGATLKGTISAGGQATTYHFEYGLSASYGKVTSTQNASLEAVNQEALATVTELAPDTQYHFRLVAENVSGPEAGEDHTFTTASPPPPAPPAPPKPPVIPPITITPFIPLSPPTTLPPKSEEAPLSGPPFLGSSVKLTAVRHSASAHGSIEINQAGVGGRLEVDLLVKGASLVKGRAPKLVSVGRFIRQSLSVGKLTFSVSLTGQGKHALTRHRSLPVTVKITLIPTHGSTVSLTRNITLHE